MKKFVIVLSLILMHVSLLRCTCYAEGKGPEQVRGLVGYWKFDGNADDSSGNNNHGKWVGRESYGKKGVLGEAADLDGLSNYVTVPHSHSINLGGAFSFGAWVHSYGNAKNQHFLNKRTGGEGPFWDMYLSADAENVNAEIAGGSYDNPASNIMPYEWHHIMFTRDIRRLTTIYVDGKPLKSKTILGDSYNTHAFNIGNLEQALDQGFNGLIDEVVIYDRSLSEEEVSSLYEAGVRYVRP